MGQVDNITMNRLLAVTVIVAAVTARPDGPGGHHHHGDHGAHHGAHHGDHGAGHHASHGANHHSAHHPEPISTVNLGSSHHHVGAGVQVAPGQHAVHNVHSVKPVHSSFSIQPEAVHHTSHSVQHAPQQNVVAPSVVKNTPKTVADLVSTNPKFSTLLTAVKAAGLTDTLGGEGPFTVFAPTNTAFDKVPVDKLNSLLNDKEALKKVLLRHVVPGTTMQGKNIPPGTTTLKTAAGEDITTTRDKFIQVNSSAGSAYIVLFDVLGSNGVVHAVDTVF